VGLKSIERRLATNLRPFRWRISNNLDVGCGPYDEVDSVVEDDVCQTCREVADPIKELLHKELVNRRRRDKLLFEAQLWGYG
jgi:hypothetical protein